MHDLLAVAVSEFDPSSFKRQVAKVRKDRKDLDRILLCFALFAIRCVFALNTSESASPNQHD